VAKFCADSYAEQMAHLDAQPGSVGQTDYVLAAEYALDCAFTNYALGTASEEVRGWLARAANALAQVFRRRGTAPGLVVTNAANGTVPRRDTSRAPDFSLTNSRRGLLAMYAALANGDHRLAEEIAGLVGDPPDASYIGPNSEVCTPEEQQLAYAVKSLLLGKNAVAAFYATNVGRPSSILHHQAAAVNALVNRDASTFLSSLDGVLARHASESDAIQNAREPRRLVCLPALGLAAHALGLDLVTTSSLPVANIYFPGELLGLK
jgi:hypothetical protein